MRQGFRYAFATAVAATAAAGAVAPPALADTTLIAPSVPDCAEAEGSSAVGGNSTECGTPGNIQLNSTPEVPEDFAYPWGDEFFGPALIFGGPGPAADRGGAHGGGR